MRPHLRTIVLAAVLFAPVWAAAQIPSSGPVPAGSASISGTVVDAQTTEPLADAVVRLSESRSARFREVKTNTAGEYEFADIADGEYMLYASSSTHVQICHGAVDPYRPRCTMVFVVRDQRRSGIDFRLSRGATIRGRVVDHEGRNVAGAFVRPVHRSDDVMLKQGNVGRTNLSGDFELTSLAAGELLLAVDATRGPDLPRLPTIYYPGVLRREDATAIEITPAMVSTGLTVVLPRVSDNAITTRVLSTATALEGLSAALVRVEPRMVRRFQLSQDHDGTIRGLPEGRYFVWARARSGDKVLAAFDMVDLVQDDYDLPLPLQPAGRITGRIVAQRGGLAPVEGVRVAAPWIYNGVEVDPLVPDQVEAGPDGAFSIDGLFGTRTLQLIGLSPEWEIHSVLHGRSDITTTGVDVLPDSTLEVTIIVSRK